jgi:hypothetical protein
LRKLLLASESTAALASIEEPPSISSAYSIFDSARYRNHAAKRLFLAHKGAATFSKV